MGDARAVLWKFRIVDPFTKRRRDTRCHFTEEEARRIYGPYLIEKLEHTRMEVADGGVKQNSNSPL
jgi:hypothetical protein